MFHDPFMMNRLLQVVQVSGMWPRAGCQDTWVMASAGSPLEQQHEGNCKDRDLPLPRCNPGLGVLQPPLPCNSFQLFVRSVFTP